jgi:hypothetical protein
MATRLVSDQAGAIPEETTNTTPNYIVNPLQVEINWNLFGVPNFA